MHETQIVFTTLGKLKFKNFIKYRYRLTKLKPLAFTIGNITVCICQYRMVFSENVMANKVWPQNGSFAFVDFLQRVFLYTQELLREVLSL
jgi:hypothetical protein